MARKHELQMSSRLDSVTVIFLKLQKGSLEEALKDNGSQ